MKDVCDELNESWSIVSAKWEAEAKLKYFNNIFSELFDVAESVYRNNVNLQNKASVCLNICGISDWRD